MLTHTIGKPRTYGGPPDIVESSRFDACFPEDFIKTPLEIIYDFEP